MLVLPEATQTTLLVFIYLTVVTRYESFPSLPIGLLGYMSAPRDTHKHLFCM